jgi:hypothetical protein
MGVSYYTNGNKYEGQWVENLKHGRGKMTYANGDVYEGDWVNDERCGPGVLLTISGDRYEGHWLKDKKEGLGRFYYRATGKLFVGEWADDVPRCGVSDASTEKKSANAIKCASICSLVYNISFYKIHFM